jgi:hypothetical protein
VGVPIKEENTAYDQITMTFLGIELDTIAIDNVLKNKIEVKAAIKLDS